MLVTCCSAFSYVEVSQKREATAFSSIPALISMQSFPQTSDSQTLVYDGITGEVGNNTDPWSNSQIY
jgi:hypothetical protein